MKTKAGSLVTIFVFVLSGVFAANSIAQQDAQIRSEPQKVKEIPSPYSNYDVRFEMKEDGDKLFINFNSDSPEATALKQHSFDINNICRLSIPEIPAEKHIFLHARGRYCVMVTLAFNYIKDCRSISIARHEDDYTCAVSFSDEIEVGEVMKRTLPNNL
jgi:hypothetical protein